jgi:hypothetical protein
MNSAKMTTGMPEMSEMPGMYNASNLVGDETNMMMMGGKKSQYSARKSQYSARKPQSSVRKATKKGGGLMDDVKNLAVPFAILLAKQGLQTMFDKKKNFKKNDGVELSAKSASKANKSASRRLSTIGGGVSQFTHQNENENENAHMYKNLQLSDSKMKNKTKLLKKGGNCQEDIDETLQKGGKGSKIKPQSALKENKKLAVKKNPIVNQKAGSKSQQAGSKSQQVKNRFEKLSSEVDNFLQKY